MRHKTLIIAIIAYIMMCSAVLSARALPFMYVMIDGVQSGPFDWDTLKKMVAEGKLTERTLVWKEGMDSWTPAEEVYSFEVEGLFRVLYYAMINGEQKGPYNKNGLRGLSDNKQLTKDTLVWSEKMDSWKPAGEISVLADLFEEKPKAKTAQKDKSSKMRRYEDDEPITDNTEYTKNMTYGILYLSIGLVFLIGGSIGMSMELAYGAWEELSDGWATTLALFSISVGSLLGGLIVTPLCAFPFRIAYLCRPNYKKETAFLRRTSIGGGYDWDKKEVTVAMAIRL